MNFYEYIYCFLAGVFIANSLPHLLHGVSGNRFPTPFSKPPGRGLSSSTINVLWALFNLIVGYTLFQAGKVSSINQGAIIVFFVGFAAISLLSSSEFTKKQRD